MDQVRQAQDARLQGRVHMIVVLLLIALSALIGLGPGTFRWPAIVTSSVAIAVISSVILQIQGFGTLPGIAIVVACSRRHRTATKGPTCNSKLTPLRPGPYLRDERCFSRFTVPCKSCVLAVLGSDFAMFRGKCHSADRDQRTGSTACARRRRGRIPRRPSRSGGSSENEALVTQNCVACHAGYRLH